MRSSTVYWRPWLALSYKQQPAMYTQYLHSSLTVFGRNNQAPGFRPIGYYSVETFADLLLSSNKCNLTVKAMGLIFYTVGQHSVNFKTVRL